MSRGPVAKQRLIAWVVDPTASRGATPAFEAAASDTVKVPILLAELYFDSGTTRLWTGYGDIVVSGQTYVGAGTLGRISSIEETQVLRAASLTIQIVGMPASVVSLSLNEDYNGRDIILKVAFIDKVGNIIDAPVTMFKGFMDVMEVENFGEQSTISIQCENRLVDLERPRILRYTDQDQKNKYPDDKGFEFVAKLSDGREIVWGGPS